MAKYHIFLNLLAKKTVVQLKNNEHKLFYRSEMEISEVHCQNFASNEQKTISACKFESQVHCQKICGTKNISPQEKKILYITKRFYTIASPKQH